MRQRFAQFAGWLVALALLIGAMALGVYQYSSALAQSTHEEETSQAHDAAGIVIAGVEAGSPAARAGVKRGNILLKIDDTEINELPDMGEALHERKAGDEVTLTVLHGDQQRTLTATLEEDGQLGIMAACDSHHSAFHVIRHSSEGAVVVEVEQDSPAEQAGLKQHDHIRAVDGQKVDAEHQLPDLIAAHKPGDEVTLEVRSMDDEESRTLNVTLGAHPDDASKAYLGVRILSGPDPDHVALRAHPFVGAVVVEVEQGSPAEQAGLKQHDHIRAVDGQKVDAEHQLSDLIAAHKPGDEITLEVRSMDDEENRTLNVTLGAHPDDASKAYLGVAAHGPVRFEMLEDAQGMHVLGTPALTDTLTEEGQRAHVFASPHGRPGQPFGEEVRRFDGGNSETF